MAQLTDSGWEGMVRQLAERVAQDLGVVGVAAMDVQQVLQVFGRQLMAAAATGAPVVCDDGLDEQPCDFVLRPGAEPYYRCLHSPPHCYRGDFTTMDPCP